MLCRGVKPYGRIAQGRFFLGRTRREDRKAFEKAKRVHVTNARDSVAFVNTPKGNITPRELRPPP